MPSRYSPLVFAPGAGGLLPEQVEAVRTFGRDAPVRLGGPTTAAAVSLLGLDDTTAWLFSRLFTLAVSGSGQADWRFELEGPQDPLHYRRYRSSSEARIGWHVDLGPRAPVERKVSVVVQLSDPDEYEGGDLELRFHDEPWQAPRTRGAAVVFPSFLLHRVTPVTAGERHVLVGWICGPPLR